MMGGYSWVTLATNDSYSLGALVLAHSLKQVGTKQHLSVLITPGVTNAMRSKLSEVFNVVQEVNVLDSKDEANLRLLKRPELGVTFTKLHCWRLTQFDKCVFLDADTLVLENCDELFEREELSAAPDIGWPDCFNSGVFVYRPSNETYEKLIEFALEKGSFDGGDQGLLNLYFFDWAHKDISKHLPFIYNMASTACYSYLPAFKQFGAMAKIIHFIGSSKPWLQYFDTETKQVHPSQGYDHLKMILQHWWDIFCSMIHPCLSPDMAGIAGAFAKLTLGQPRTAEQLALDDHLRRQGWEVGKIDYLGRDSFDNIWNKICETLSSAPTLPEQKTKDPSSSSSEVKELEQSLTEVKTDIEESSESISPTQVISLSTTDLGITSEALSKQTPNLPPTEHSPLLPPPDLSKSSTQSQPALEHPETMSDTKQPSQQVAAESKLVAESEQIVKGGFKPNFEPSIAVSESSKPVSELQKTIVEPPTPVTEPATPDTELPKAVTELPTPVTKPPTPVTKPPTPVTEPLTPVTEPLTPSTEPTKPVAESQKPVTEPPKPVTEPPKPVAELPKTVAEPPKPVAEPPQPIAEPPNPVAEPPKPVAEPPKPVAKPPKPVAEPPKPIAEPPKPVAEPPKPFIESPKPVVESPKPVAESPKPVVEYPRTVAEPPKTVAELPETVAEPPQSPTGISPPVAESPKPVTEGSKLALETPKSGTEPTNTTAESPKIISEPQKSLTESLKPRTEPSKSTAKSVGEQSKPVGEQSKPFQAEKSVSEGCSVKSKQTSSGESKDSRKSKGIPKTQVTETTPPTSPVWPQTKQALNVDTSIPDTPPPAAQESATAGPTPPPRKGSSGTKKTASKTKK